MLQEFPGRSLRPVEPESPAPWIFLSSGKSVVRYLIPLRSTTGGYPESPGGRSIRPLLTGVSGQARILDKSPPWCGVSGRAGVSGPLPRSLRPSIKCAMCGELRVPCPEEPRKKTGVSGLPRSLRPSYPGVSGISDSKRLVFAEGYKYPFTYLRPASSPSIYEP